MTTEPNPPDDLSDSPANSSSTATDPGGDAATSEAGSSFSDDDLLRAATEPLFGGDDEPESSERVAASSRPGLTRSRADCRVAGVAAGVARSLGIDPTFVRVAFVGLALCGVGAIAYLALWVLMPENDGVAEQIWRPRGQTSTTNAAAVAIAAALVSIAIITDSWTLFALVLIGAGAWILTRPPADGVDHSAGSWVETPATPQPPGPPTSRAFLTANAHYPSSSGGGTTGAKPKVRASQRITTGVFALLALLGGLAAAAAAGGWWDVRVSRLIGIALIIIGTGVVLGALLNGGARWLSVVGLFTAALLVPATFADGLIADGVGSTAHRPSTAAELADEYRLGAGELVVDLRDIDPRDLDHPLNIELGVGELTVYLPEGLSGRASITAGAGEIRHTVSPGTALAPTPPPGAPWIDLDFADSNSGPSRTLDGLSLDTGVLELNGDSGSLILTVSVGVGTVDVSW